MATKDVPQDPSPENAYGIEEQRERRNHDIRRQNAFQRVLTALATGTSNGGDNSEAIQHFLDKRKQEESLREKIRLEEELERRTILILKEQRLRLKNRFDPQSVDAQGLNPMIIFGGTENEKEGGLDVASVKSASTTNNGKNEVILDDSDCDLLAAILDEIEAESGKVNTTCLTQVGSQCDAASHTGDDNVIPWILQYIERTEANAKY